MLSKQEFLDSLIRINPNYNTELIGRAYELGVKMHEGQLRKSGEPYFIHPLAVATILAELGMDDEAIVAGLLHDVVEDTPYTKEELSEDFGENVMLLVDGVTKLGSLKFESKKEEQAENLRKMFLAMSKDIRVLIIKLADRLHNLRTINYMSEAKIREKCQETIDIYAPLASRLGIYTMKFEMEDISLKYLEPEAYKDLVQKVALKKQQRNEIIESVMNKIRDSLEGTGIEYELMGRSKHLYSIYKKMKYQNKQIDEIFDLTAVRVLVENIRDCYAVLGVVHTMWKPIPGRFKDYIAMPKPNMYQSLHTTVIGDNGDPFEIQIRTYEMHKIAEYGIAAHWKYKEGISADKEELKLAWLRQTLELQKDSTDSLEFMEGLKVDFFASQVFVFTPKGEVMELPAGSTPLDFAFKIHSDVGYKCIGAKINGKMVPIDHTLNNGDIVEIVTSSNSSGPSTDWLRIAKSTGARAKIRNWLKKENRNENVDKGKEALEKYVKRKGQDPQVLLKSSYVNKAYKDMNISTLDEFYSQISHGGPLLSKAYNILLGYLEHDRQEEQKRKESEFRKLDAETNKPKKREHQKGGVTIEGNTGLLIRLSKCCNPVPGDEIIGYTTKGRGVSVHRVDCPNIVSLPESEKGRLIEVSWDESKGSESYDTDISLVCDDRKGLFTDLSRTCEDMGMHIAGLNARSVKDGGLNITLTLSLSNTSQMQTVLANLRKIPGVVEVYRSI